MVTRRVKDYGGDHTDVLLLNALMGEGYRGGGNASQQAAAAGGPG